MNGLPSAARFILVTMCTLAALPTLAADAQGRQRIRVRVVDVSGGRAYVEPGAEAGIGRGDRVVIGRRRYEVVGVTGSYASIEIGNRAIEVGARGTAISRRRAGEEDGAALAEPRPLSAFRGQWPDATLPSSEQQPDYVPLGTGGGESRRLALALSTDGAAFIPLGGVGGALGRANLRTRVHAEPFEAVPFSVDADAALQVWMGADLASRPGRNSQPILRVRELQVAYGDQADFYAALGRMRYAASTIGQLDGLRVQTPSLSGFTVGAFGGFVPDPLDGVPTFDTSRFGVEARFRAPEHELRPMVAVVGHGSVYGGNIDERRLTATADIFPGDSRIGAHAEMNLYDEDNPWGADTFELSAAGVDGDLRVGAFRAGARFDMRRPERSNWLAAYLPPSWLCARTPGAPNTPTADEACSSMYEPRYVGAANVGLEFDKLAVVGGGTLIHVGEVSDLEQLGGYLSVRGVRLFDFARADLTLSASTGSVIETFALRAGIGAEIVPGVFDIQAHYRPAITRYRADIDRYFEHMIGGGFLLTPIPELDITVDVDGLTSRDLDALLLLAGMTWRPELF